MKDFIISLLFMIVVIASLATYDMTHQSTVTRKRIELNSLRLKVDSLTDINNKLTKTYDSLIIVKRYESRKQTILNR